MERAVRGSPADEARSARALALARRLADEHLGRLVSSPYVRCVQTLEPLALTTDLPIETTELLAESTGGGSAVALVLPLADDRPIACCTHGDVVHEVIASLADAGVVLDGPREVPVASTWVLDVEAGRISGTRFVEPPPR